MKENRHKKNWTDEETDYLCERWGNSSIDSIANHLGRTRMAVSQKAVKLGLGEFLQNGDKYITKHELFSTVGCQGSDGYKNISWIKNRGLQTHKIKRLDKTFEVIYLDEFWKWAFQNRTFLDFSEFEKFSLGPEPNWVDEKRRHDKRRSQNYIKTPWTRLEDERLKKTLNKGKYGYKELSKMFHRTEGAIQRRICDLGIKERPLKADNHNKWSDDDYFRLGELIKQGFTYESMSDVFGRSAKAIRGRVFDMYLIENLDKVRIYIGNGRWGDGRPQIPLKYKRLMTKEDRDDAIALISIFAGAILASAKKKANVSVKYSEFWQKDICMNWDDTIGCTACEKNCDTCISFQRIPVQFCKRCGKSFYERKSNDFCIECREARLRQARRKYAYLNKHGRINNESKNTKAI